MRKTSRPCAVVVSRASVKLRNPIPRTRRFFDSFDQLLHRTRQAVELPHDQRIAAAREFEGVMQGGPICNRTRHLLDENLCAPCFGQRVAL
jgi:hypothetical protein